jgi:peroxiredoxin
VVTHSKMVALGTRAPGFALPEAGSGRIYALADFAGSTAFLVAFLCNHCPYVQHLLDGFVKFAREYQAKGLALVAISSNDAASYPQDAPPAMARLATERDFTFPYLFDETQEVAKAYQAVCTPDFFLFDREQRMVYRGQFDASRPGNKIPVTGADLRAAVDLALRDEPVPEPQTPSAGCSIKWKMGANPDW